jgi:signal transduction histidine kinase
VIWLTIFRVRRDDSAGGAVYDPRVRSDIGRSVAILAAVTAVYVAAGRLGLSLAIVHTSASAVWPPTGIALAALLVFGLRVWPAILVGAFLVNSATEVGPAASLAIAIGNTLEGVVGARLALRFAGGPHAFDRTRDVFRFLLLAGFVATAISPTIGVTSLCLGGLARWSEYAVVWTTWWLGDAGGAVVVAPALILWARNPRPGWSGWQAVEAGLALVATVLVGSVVFGAFLLPADGRHPLTFLCLPLTIWTAFRFGPRETATAVLLLSVIAVEATLRGDGYSPGRGENESLLLLQLFMSTVAVTSLGLAAVVEERRRALETSRRHAAELARSNAELDEFARVVSHDLKAPLRGISSLAAWIAEDDAAVLSDASREHLTLLGQRARRMSQLIDGVLRYSSAGTHPVIEPVDSGALIAEVVDSLGPLGAVSVRLAGAFPVVRCDRTQLAQVFQNLIGNAVQHLGRSSGRVVVACREAAGAAEFSVSDDGVGIVNRLEPMFQGFEPEAAEHPAEGVGLAIVRKIVERRGGSLAVEPAPAGGTVFRFSIPTDPV